MISHHVYYQLAILGFLWLFVMLHSAWPSRGAPAQGTPAKPILPRRQRSKEPKPFAGLTHKPPVSCVSTRQPIPSTGLPCDLIRCRRPTDARVSLRPRCIFVPTTAVTIAAGWGWAISAPTDFLPFVNPHGPVFLPHLHGRL